MWEYRVEIVSVGGPQVSGDKTPEMQLLAKLGAEGWELVYAISVRSFMGQPEVRMYFKRPRKA